LLSVLKKNDYYSGVVVDESGRPVENALVREFIADSSYARQVTDNNGYFEFKRSESILPDMIISKNGFITDTIPLVYSVHGEYLEYSSMILKDSSKFTLQRVK
jgi:hypothetical protein